jgi:hypothetical protein
MLVTMSLPVRTWAALDAALEFFRTAPIEIAASRRLGKACRRLHQALARTGLRSHYVPVGVIAPGRSVLRLRVETSSETGDILPMALPVAVARGLAKACLAVICVQADPEMGRLLDHEAEEIQAARDFLSELRRQSQDPGNAVGRVPHSLHWDERRQEYGFSEPVAWQVLKHYLSAGACLN